MSINIWKGRWCKDWKLPELVPRFAEALVTKDKNDGLLEEKSEAIVNKQDANTIDTKATVEEEAIVEGETEVVAQDAKSIDTKSIVEEEAVQVSGADELQG